MRGKHRKTQGNRGNIEKQGKQGESKVNIEKTLENKGKRGKTLENRENQGKL